MAAQSEGDLQSPQCPDPAAVEKLIRYKLAVVRTPEGQTLQFAVGWSQKRVDRWFRELTPLVFKFLDAHYPEDSPPSFHWVLLGKSQRNLFTINRADITGDELNQAKGPSNRKYQEHAVRIATKHRIPSSVYKNWADAIKRLESGEQLESESEVEVNVRPSKGKGKARVRKQAPAKTVSDDAMNAGLRAYWGAPYATHTLGRSGINQFIVGYLQGHGIIRTKEQVASRMQVLRERMRKSARSHLAERAQLNEHSLLSVINPQSPPKNVEILAIIGAELSKMNPESISSRFAVPPCASQLRSSQRVGVANETPLAPRYRHSFVGMEEVEDEGDAPLLPSLPWNSPYILDG
ncbi:hypothetical protein B0H11DRAFT_2321742 [Mycena galericulata]|nr:hypothetical protein B0H11DRAFT_2321742 [Mycena galericulata]